MNSNPASQTACPPWWTFGYVWLLISGPAVVVVAGFVTLWLALAYPETLVTQEPERARAQAQRPDERMKALAPAVQARNHAATDAPARPR